MKETISFQGRPVLRLSRGGASILVAPQHGGLLLQWTLDGKEIVHWPADADWSKLTKIRGGDPILFPFIARHYVDGVLGRWKDVHGVVRDLPQHGFVREMPFEVVESTDPTADPYEIRLRVADTEATRAMYPFSFRFEVAYRLGEDTLEVEFLTTNTGPAGSAPLPYYAGHHFYLNFPARERAAWTLELPFAKSGYRDDDGNPLWNELPPTDTTLDDPDLVDCFHTGPLETTFAASDPATGAKITFDLNPPGNGVPWHTVTTWNESPEADYFCIEPWLGLPNAIHHGDGLRLLAPGATEKAVCALRYSAGH
jgi:galactose mutarotase-like enzyme